MCNQRIALGKPCKLSACTTPGVYPVFGRNLQEINGSSCTGAIIGLQLGNQFTLEPQTGSADLRKLRHDSYFSAPQEPSLPLSPPQEPSLPFSPPQEPSLHFSPPQEPSRSADRRVGKECESTC